MTSPNQLSAEESRDGSTNRVKRILRQLISAIPGRNEALAEHHDELLRMRELMIHTMGSVPVAGARGNPFFALHPLAARVAACACLRELETVARSLSADARITDRMERIASAARRARMEIDDGTSGRVALLKALRGQRSPTSNR